MQHVGQSWEELAVGVLVVDLDMLPIIFHAPAQEPCPVNLPCWLHWSSHGFHPHLPLMNLPMSVAMLVLWLVAFSFKLKKKKKSDSPVLLKQCLCHAQQESHEFQDRLEYKVGLTSQYSTK